MSDSNVIHNRVPRHRWDLRNGGELNLRLMTLNIRYGAGCENLDKPGYDLPSPAKKLTALAEAIGSVDPALVALQEVRNEHQAKSIAHLLGMNSVYLSHPLGYRLYFFQWGLAFLHRFKMVETGSRTIFFEEEAGTGRVGLLVKMNIHGRVVSHLRQFAF